MRRVYNPPTSGGNWITIAISAIIMTLAVFLVLPLTQMLSSHVQKKRFLSTVDLAAPPPPPDIEAAPPEPPPEPEPDQEPPPQLSDAPRPLNLNISLDVAMGDGGALSSLSESSFQSAAQNLSNLAVDMSDLDNKPVLLASTAPDYPPALQKSGVEGSVTILFLLNESGLVEDPRVERSTRPEFESPALDAVRGWKFKPGMKEGQPVRTFMRLPIQFKIST